MPCNRRALLFGLATLGCGNRLPSAEGTPLPAALDGLPLVQIVGGARAARAVARLHDREVAPDASWIGRYGADDEYAVVYASRYRDAAEADRQLRRMGERIGAGSGPFGHHRTLTVAGRTVHGVLSPGTVNYFFVRGTDLLWMALPPARARAALADGLALPPDSIPSAPPLETRPPPGGSR